MSSTTPVRKPAQPRAKAGASAPAKGDGPALPTAQERRANGIVLLVVFALIALVMVPRLVGQYDDANAKIEARQELVATQARLYAPDAVVLGVEDKRFFTGSTEVQVKVGGRVVDGRVDSVGDQVTLLVHEGREFVPAVRD